MAPILAVGRQSVYSILFLDRQIGFALPSEEWTWERRLRARRVAPMLAQIGAALLSQTVDHARLYTVFILQAGAPALLRTGCSVAPKHRRVVVVGGGPVGLVSALALAQHDIPVLVLEAHPDLFMDLRAGSFHPPTLEVLQASGVTQKLLEIGIVVPAWQLRDRTEGVIAVFELASLLKDETPYPFRLHCEQHKLTPVVYDMLKRLPHAEVRFSSCVTEVLRMPTA